MSKKKSPLKPLYFVIAILIIAIGFFTIRLLRNRAATMTEQDRVSTPSTSAKPLIHRLAGLLTKTQEGKLNCEAGFRKNNADDPPGFDRFVSLASCVSTDSQTAYNLISFANVIASAKIQQTLPGAACTPSVLEKLFGVKSESIKDEKDEFRGLVATSTNSGLTDSDWQRELIVIANCRKGDSGIFRITINMPAAALTLKDLRDDAEDRAAEPALLQVAGLISDVVNVEVARKKERNFEIVRGVMASRNEAFIRPTLQKAVKLAEERNYPASSVELIKKVLAQAENNELLAEQLKNSIATLPQDK